MYLHSILKCLVLPKAVYSFVNVERCELCYRFLVRFHVMVTVGQISLVSIFLHPPVYFEQRFLLTQ